MRALVPVLVLWVLSQMDSAQASDPAATELAGPAPVAVVPGARLGDPPSDAIVLFDGQSLDRWQPVEAGKPSWQVRDGILTVVPGAANIKTRQSFGDVQLHVEWRAPARDQHQRDLQAPMAAKIRAQVESRLGMHQFLANSGVFLQQRYEVQVLETYDASTYVNGQAGAVYKQHPPLVEAAREAGAWQAYDIVFQAPRFGEQGALVVPAHMTVLLNGVLVQNHVALWGPTEFIGAPQYQLHGDAPIELQSHVGVSQISYRNIWVRPL